MATTLALAMRASMSAGGVTSGANDAAKALDKFGKQARATARDVATLKTIEIGKLIGSGISAAANAFQNAGRAVLSYATSVVNAVDSTNDLAARTGIGVEALQALQMAAKLSGMEDVTGAVQKLGVAIGNAAQSGKIEAFTQLGLDFEKLEAMSPEEQFKAVQKAIAALPTEAQRAAAAVQIFGRAGVEMLPLMNQDLAEMEDRMRRLGAIVGDDQVEAISSMNDALDMTRAMFDGIIGTVAGNLALIVESLAEDVMKMVESFNSANTDTGGVAGAITDALLDIADYLAAMFDNAIVGFDDFGQTMSAVGEAFSFVANVFTAVAELLRAAFNGFQVAGNLLALGLGKFLEGLGSWVSSDLEQVGKDMAANAQREGDKNFNEATQAASNAANAAKAAVFGGGETQRTSGPAGRAVAAARARMNPEEQERRKQERDRANAEKKAAREAAAAAAKAASEAAAKQKEIDKKQEEVAKASAFKDENAKALGEKSNEALKANDIRSSEGMAQFFALATGREDPAIAEYRKQTQKLDEIRSELRALQQEKVDILGAAA